MRGADYFDYDGDCNITEIRNHVQGDIYHSQLIEIGSPDGNTQFTDNNQEAYYRTINNYQNFRAMHSRRKPLMLDLIVECYMQSMLKLEMKVGICPTIYSRKITHKN